MATLHLHDDWANSIRGYDWKLQEKLVNGTRGWDTFVIIYCHFFCVWITDKFRSFILSFKLNWKNNLSPNSQLLLKSV